MTLLFTIVASILVVSANAEQQLTEIVEASTYECNALMAKGPGTVHGYFQKGDLQDPFMDLSDDFDISLDPVVANCPPTAAMQLPAKESLEPPATETVPQGEVKQETVGWFPVNSCIYFTCVFIAELLVVFAAAGLLQWWRSHPLKLTQKSVRKPDGGSRQRTVVDTQDEYGCTALHAASSSGSVSGVRVLLENGADVSAREAWEGTPLHFAASSGNLEICEALLQHGAEVNPLNSDDETPLLLAGRAGKEAVCTLLLDYGAHVGDVTELEVPLLINSLLAQRIFNKTTFVKAA